MISRHSLPFYITIILFLGACTSHPPVMPEMPKEGETKMGFSFSVENVIPTIWWRYGLNNYTDIGFKLGIPVSGTGVDISRLLMKKDRRWDMLNFAYSISPNSSLDLTYYMFKVHKKEKLSFLSPPLRTRWRAFRLMIIPNGNYNNPAQRGSKISTRLGLLFGRRFGEKWGFETGYFHDLKAGWSDNQDYPHNNPEKPYWPTQFSKGMGVSIQLFLYISPFNKN